MTDPKFLSSDKWFSYIDHLVEETVPKKKKKLEGIGLGLPTSDFAILSGCFEISNITTIIIQERNIFFLILPIKTTSYLGPELQSVGSKHWGDGELFT